MRSKSALRLFQLLVLFFTLACTTVGQEPRATATEHVILKNENLRLLLSTPHSSDNHRGTRFDHSGIFHEIKFQGVSLCERWHTGPLNTSANDDVAGPCEEFGNASPLAYKPNQPGSLFLKIGVGILRQPAEDRYRFSFPYEVVQEGTWIIDKADKFVRFKQSIGLDEQVQYAYVKTIAIEEHGFSIHHQLDNTGREAWSTDHYNHNFFLINSDNVGPNYRLEFPFEIMPTREQSLFATLVMPHKNSLTFRRNLVDRESFFAELAGHRQQINDHAFALKHVPTGISIECHGDAPLHKFNVWGMKNTICPEPYVAFTLHPGESKSWTLRYRIRKD
jgi:hypothetical protein